jgi:hypothetical protein
MPGRSTARRPGYCRRRKSTSSAIARPTRPAGSGVALVSPTERHPRPARGVAFPVCRCVRRCGTWPWLARGRDRGWQAPLLFSLAGMCSPTAVRLAHQNPKGRRTSKKAGQSGGRRPRGERRSDRIQTREVLSGRSTDPRTRNRPAFLLVRTGVEPPAGIGPATPSLPWNHREPLCGPPFPQVTPDRRGRSYRFSFGEGMRSLPPWPDPLGQAGIIPAVSGLAPTVTLTGAAIHDRRSSNPMIDPARSGPFQARTSCWRLGPRPGGSSAATGPACGARKTPPARTPPAGRGC